MQNLQETIDTGVRNMKHFDCYWFV